MTLDIVGMSRAFLARSALYPALSSRSRSFLACNHILTAVCAILSDTVGTPSTCTPPDFFGIGTPLTGGGI
jgi:hypothetical protein